MEIEYVDYMVARNFLGLIDEWFSVLPRAQSNGYIALLQRYSHWIPKISRFFTAVCATLVLIGLLPHFVVAEVSNLFAFGQFAIFGCLGVYVAYTLAGWLGTFTEHALDGWSEISYLKINRGDAAELKASITKNKTNLLKAAFGFILTMSVSVVSKILATILISYFVKSY